MLSSTSSMLKPSLLQTSLRHCARHWESFSHRVSWHFQLGWMIIWLEFVWLNEEHFSMLAERSCYAINQHSWLSNQLLFFECLCCKCYTLHQLNLISVLVDCGLHLVWFMWRSAFAHQMVFSHYSCLDQPQRRPHLSGQFTSSTLFSWLIECFTSHVTQHKGSLEPNTPINWIKCCILHNLMGWFEFGPFKYKNKQESLILLFFIYL